MAIRIRKRLLLFLAIVAAVLAGVLLAQTVDGDHHARTIQATASVQIGNLAATGFPHGVFLPILESSQYRLESYSPHGFTFVTADGFKNPYQGSSTAVRFLEMLTTVSPPPRTRTMQVGNSDNNVTTTAHSPFRLKSDDTGWDTDTKGDGLIIGNGDTGFSANGQIWRMIPEAQLDVNDPPKQRHAYLELTPGGDNLLQYMPGGYRWESGNGVAQPIYQWNSGTAHLATGKKFNAKAVFNAAFQALPVTGTCSGGTYPGSGCHTQADCVGGGTCNQVGGEAGVYEGHLEHRAPTAGNDWNRWVDGFGTGTFVARMRSDGTNAHLEWGAASTMDVGLSRTAANELTLAAGDTFVSDDFQGDLLGDVTGDLAGDVSGANDVGLNAGGTITFGGGALVLDHTVSNELSVSAGDWIAAESVLITKATIPFTCAAAHDGRMYYDTTGNGALCLCVDDGSAAWEVVHGTGACA